MAENWGFIGALSYAGEARERFEDAFRAFEVSDAAASIRSPDPRLVWAEFGFVPAAPRRSEQARWWVIRAEGDIAPDPRRPDAAALSGAEDPFLIGLERWADDLGGAVLGEFQLIAWDALTEELVAVTDAFASVPLYYHRTLNGLLFSDRPSALLATGALSAELDQSRVADHLLRANADTHATYFREIRRVPPGSVLRFGQRGLRVRRWWRPEEAAPNSLEAREAKEEIAVAFHDAVRRSLSAARRNGLLLSGGLDSGAIAVAAARLLGPDRTLDGLCIFPETVADVAPSEGWDVTEEPYLRALEDRYANLRIHRISLPGGSPLDGMADETARRCAPLFGLNHFWLSGLIDAAHARGVVRLLHGQQGNTALSWEDHFMPARLLREGRLWQAAREIVTTARSDGVPFTAISRTELMRPLRASLRAPRVSDGWRRYSPIGPAFAESMGIQDRLRRAMIRPTALSRPRDDMLMQLNPLHCRLGEAWRPMAASRGLSLRDPTADRRVVELCLAAPDEVFRRNGARRLAIREAMGESAPAVIRDRVTRGMQCPDMLMRVRPRRAEIVEMLERFARNEAFAHFVDVPRVLDTAREPLTQTSLRFVWRALSLGVFIEVFERPLAAQTVAREWVTAPPSVSLHT